MQSCSGKALQLNSLRQKDFFAFFAFFLSFFLTNADVYYIINNVIGRDEGGGGIVTHSEWE